MEWRIITEVESSKERTYDSGSLTFTQLKREWSETQDAPEGSRTFIEQKDEDADAEWTEVDPAQLLKT